LVSTTIKGAPRAWRYRCRLDQSFAGQALAQGPDFRQLLLNGARGGAESRFQAVDGLIVEAAPVAAGGGG
jgi:hypothetical protein